MGDKNNQRKRKTKKDQDDKNINQIKDNKKDESTTPKRAKKLLDSQNGKAESKNCRKNLEKQFAENKSDKTIEDSTSTTESENNNAIPAISTGGQLQLSSKQKENSKRNKNETVTTPTKILYADLKAKGDKKANSASGKKKDSKDKQSKLLLEIENESNFRPDFDQQNEEFLDDTMMDGVELEVEMNSGDEDDENEAESGDSSEEDQEIEEIDQPSSQTQQTRSNVPKVTMTSDDIMSVVANNDAIKNLVEQLVAKEMQTCHGDTGKKQKRINKADEQKQKPKTGAKNKGEVNKFKLPYMSRINLDNNRNLQVIEVKGKSPSDTTIYRPAVRQKKIDEATKTLMPRLNNVANINKPVQTEQQIKNKASIDLLSISSYLDKIRSEVVDVRSKPGKAGTSDLNDEEMDSDSEERSPPQLGSKELAEQAIINAEKFKADISTPGTSNFVPPVDLNFDDDKG